MAWSFRRRIKFRGNTTAAGGGGTWGDHPRLWISQSNRAGMYSKIQTGAIANDQFKTIVLILEAEWATPYTSISSVTRASCCYAYVYQMMLEGASNATTGASFTHTTATDWGDRARDLMLSQIGATPQIGTEEQEYGMVVYDWVYDRLSSANKTTFADWIKTVDNLSAITNPFISSDVSRLNFEVMGGLTLSGDGVLFTGGASADTWATAAIAKYQSYFRELTGATRGRSFLSGDDGVAAAGRSYEFGHTYMRIFRIEEAYRTSYGITKSTHYGGTSGINDARSFRTIPQFFAYSILPWAVSNGGYPGGRIWLIEKGYYEPATELGVTNNEYRTWLNAMSGAYEGVSSGVQELAEWLLVNKTGKITGTPALSALHWWMEWCLYAPSSTPTATSPTSLGLATNRVFNDGNIILRQDWTSLDASYVTVAAYKWIIDTYHSPLHSGSIQIHRNGPAIILAGGASGHDYGSGQLPGSNNTWRFTNRSSTTSYPDDMGGARVQSSPGSSGAAEFIEDTKTDIRGRNSSASALEFAYHVADGSSRIGHYVYVDTTRLYQSDDYTEAGRATKIVSMNRQVVYFPAPSTALSSAADQMFLFDRFSLKTGGSTIRAEFDLHTSAEPIVSGYSTTDTISRSTNTYTRYLNATMISSTNTVDGSSNTSFIWPLLPAMDVVKVWGPDSTGGRFTATSHEMENPYGENQTNLGSPPAATIVQYVTEGRVELHPHTHSDTNYTLTGIEVWPVAGATPSTMTAGESSNMVWGRCSTNRFVAFHKTLSGSTGGVFVMSEPGTYKVVIGGVAAHAQRTLTPGGNINIEGTGAGSAYSGADALASTSHSIEVDVVVSSSGTGAANTVTMS